MFCESCGLDVYTYSREAIVNVNHLSMISLFPQTEVREELTYIEGE